MIKIEYFDRDTGEIFPVCISDYSHVKDSPYYMVVIDPDEVVIESNKVTITFDYPLNKPVEFEFEQDRDIRRIDLFRMIYEGYKKIYEEEDVTSSVEAGLIPGMLNRNVTDGKYGIWGHGIDDLVIEGVFVDGTNVRLAIGS